MDTADNLPGQWMEAMRSGAFEDAWKHNEELMKLRAGKPCWHLPRHFQYVWDGTPLQGKKVLIRCYHGLGDTIQFIRYALQVKAIAAQVIVWTQPKLMTVLQTVEGIDKLLPLHDGTPEIEYDVDVEIMELPYIFRTTMATIPSAIPYLSITSPKKDLSQNGKLAVGLVWKAGDWDEHRSMPFSFLLPLSGIDGIQFYIVQPNALTAGWANQFGSFPGEFDLYEYTKYIAALDLLISIDSMPVHVAGALGIPVWTMLQANADWRWMNKREDSPWYPTMKLFRQKDQGDWQPVISRIALELKQLVSKTSS